MDWIVISLRWYIMLFLLGLIFVPLTKKIFGNIFFDLAGGTAKSKKSLSLRGKTCFLGNVLPLREKSFVQSASPDWTKGGSMIPLWKFSVLSVTLW